MNGGRESRIDHDLRVCFGAGDAAKIQSIARYWLETDGNTLLRLDGWQLMHELPYPYGISEDIYGELFRSLVHDESGNRGFLMARAGHRFTRPVIAYDSTIISTCSQNQHAARRGFSKDRDGLDAIKLLTLCSVRDGHELAFRQKRMELKRQVEEGVADFTEAASGRIAKYLVCSRAGRGAGGASHSTRRPEQCEFSHYF